jgi:hypothetical protein
MGLEVRMADRDGAVAAGPPTTSVADEPTPEGTAAANPAAPVVGQRKAGEAPSFFDQPVRDADLGADRVVLDASPAEVVTGAQAETTELRAALDDLRRVLDDVDAAKVTPRRRRLPVVAITGGLAAVAVAGLVVSGTMTGDDTTGEVTNVSSSGSDPDASPAQTAGAPVPGASSTAPSSAPTSVSTSAPTGAGSVTATPTGPQPSVVAPAALPADGPGVTVPGSSAVATIESRTGDVQIYEQFIPGTPQSALPLSLLQPTALRGDAARARPQLKGELTVLLDGQQARAVPTGGNAWVAAPAAGARFTRAVLRYTVTGGFVLSTPSTKGRGLILLSPVTGSTGLQLGHPVRLITVGAQVNSINCPTLPAATTVCEQTPQGATHTALVPVGSPDALMMLSVDLPQAS